jgi:hypothetical protein
MKNINIDRNDKSKAPFSIFGTDSNVSAKKNLSRLPVFSNIEKIVVSLTDVLWDYAIELTTDDFVTPYWEDYRYPIDEICRDFIGDDNYLEANILPVMSYDKEDQLVRILVLIGHKHFPHDEEAIDSHRCLNLKFHRHFCNEKVNYTYKHYAKEDPVYIPVDGVNEVIEAYRHEGEIHYLPERMQLPFWNAMDLARYRLQVCAAQ